MSGSPLDRVHLYHDGTKHHFHRFARSLGHLDWASQPRPFRSFEGAPVVSLYPARDGAGARQVIQPRVAYDDLFHEPTTSASANAITIARIGDALRHALGLSAWKAIQGSRWALRVNPSSGNLHPTEAYIVTGALPDLDARASGVWHYAPDRHAIERRCEFAADAWSAFHAGEPTQAFFVGLTSIHWREAWKYGERAFRYCQHDLGHAIAAVRLAAALHGWRVTIMPGWSHRAMAALLGLDRDEDYVEAEREEPACVLLVTAGASVDQAAAFKVPDARVLDAVRSGRWFGNASQLSEDHVEWTFIDEVAEATRQGEAAPGVSPPSMAHVEDRTSSKGGTSSRPVPIDARRIILQRRSAVSLDGMSSIDRATFLEMLLRVMPDTGAPWDTLWWTPRIHLALLVHRVEDVAPGLYLLARSAEVVPRLKASCRPEFLWEPVQEGVPLWLLQRGDCRLLAKRVSCDQDIAADGYFSLGMIADFDASLAADGAAFYRHLFWESGVVGQVLYLEAEAAGARATGIGCFFDDAVHEVLGLEGHAFQSLYHFTIGIPVEDTRLTTEAGYPWEK